MSKQQGLLSESDLVAELQRRILALIPTNPDLLDTINPWKLFEVPGFKCDDIHPYPLVSQAAIALTEAQKVYHMGNLGRPCSPLDTIATDMLTEHLLKLIPSNPRLLTMSEVAEVIEFWESLDIKNLNPTWGQFGTALQRARDAYRESQAAAPAAEQPRRNIFRKRS
jgi:hypothetical protein